MNNLDNWLNHSENFNLFIGLITVLGLISIIAYTLLLNKIGKKDEYSTGIRLRITHVMFATWAVLFIIFIAWVPDSMVHMKQMVYLCMALTAFAGAVSAAYYYIRDFRS